MKKNRHSIHRLIILLLISLISSFSTVQAVDSTPPVFVYEGKLLDAANNPIITSHTFRFSLWSSDDFQVGDVDGLGAINVGAPNYSGWQEEHVVTPNTDGTFFVELGENTPLAEMNASQHKYLMVEIKAELDPDTSFELMDPTGDDGADTDDRQTMGSTPFTNNADYLDNAEIGTSAGDLATLSFGDVWDISFIPGGTNADNFVLDHDNTVGPGGHIELQFGDLLSQILSFDVTNDWFEFNNDLSLNQNELKDVAIDNRAAAPGAPVDGQIYHNTTDGNTYIWNGAVWEDITDNGGAGTGMAVFNAEYEDAVVDIDGSNNKGTLTSHFVDEGGPDKYNYYEWNTTEGTLQDVDIYVSFKLPDNFDGFTVAPLSLLYRSNDGVAANNQIDVTLYDSNGDAVTLVGGTDLANASWTTENITFGGAPVFNAGENITLKLTLSTINTHFARVADIIFNYNTL